MAVLTAQNLAKSYRGRQVVYDVSLSVSSGQIIGLLGPNGAGKSTCFHMIVGIISVDAGTICLDDQDLTGLSVSGRARRGLGYLPQEASIFRKLSVADNIMAILETRSDLSHQQRTQRLEELLEEFHITHLRDTQGMALSGGERRRAEIARALATEPAFILLDEPFAGIDPISVTDIKHIITHLKSLGIGVLITDHNVREALDICEMAYVVGEGHVIAQGDAQTILNTQAVRDSYLGHQFVL